MTTDTHEKTRRGAARRSQLDRRVAMRLAADEYERIADAIAAIPADAWHRPTDCPDWDVRQLVCHVIGMSEMVSGIREGARQQKLAGSRAKAEGIALVDALTALQVAEKADWSPQRLVHQARAVAPRAARGRRLTPFFLRRKALPDPELVNGQPEVWSLGYLIDTILTRDPWMHRVDLARATGVPLRLTAEHDGTLVADVVAEWAQRHGAPYDLTLTGPAGGHWTAGAGADVIEMDAVEFCRVVSGRGEGSGLLTTQVPF
jgi:uncharacterized protein (TIGR03083 family)